MEKGFMYSVLKEKCPRCNEGDLFKHKELWSLNLSEIGKTHDKCPVCGQDYKMEDGFFLGATYVSYAFGIAIAVPLLLVLWVGFHVDFLIILGIIGLTLAILTPPIIKYSRSIWFNMFVHYEEDWKTKEPEHL